MRSRQAVTGLLVLLVAGGCSRYAGELPAVVDYNFHVRPLLSDRCYACHGPDPNARQGELRLDTQAGLFDSLTAEGVPAVLPGAQQGSPLWQRISSSDHGFVMPPPEETRRLSDRDIALLGRWIDQGAHWKPHWAFDAPTKPAQPDVSEATWPKNALDYFVLARMEGEGLSPAPEAEKATLIRRASLDLIGLPPTPKEVDDFLVDTSPDSFERVVDRLLADHRYGERWAWDWLDAARYADTNGFQGDPTRTMWPWRDWVVQAINDNMPYDEFTVWQIAGDLLPDATTAQILATAFNRNHMYNGEGGRIPEETRVENVFDRTETVGTLWMGLTLNCARCHDHKFDPVTQREYYQLFDYFNQTTEAGIGPGGKVPPVLDVSSDAQRADLGRAQRLVNQRADAVGQIEERLFPRAPGLTAADSPAASGLLGEHTDALRLAPKERSGYYLDLLQRGFAEEAPDYAKALGSLRSAVGSRDQVAGASTLVMVMDSRPERRPTNVLTRGGYDQPGDTVSMDVPAFLPPIDAEKENDRLALAQWLVSDTHPLTARVTVNRYWQAFFGMGLVETPEDFGAQGALPSHPALLDYLATAFVESGWDVKALHRRIVTSATYRQSSRVTDLHREVDPANTYLARGPRFRLPSWMIRDQALAISGLLVDSLGGPPVRPYQPPGIWSEATFGQTVYEQDFGDALYRRSLYTFWRRIVGPPVFFDNANRQVCTVTKSLTNTPLHALTTLNDVTFVEAARVMAERVLQLPPADRLEWAFRAATARPPDALEQDILNERLDTLKKHYAEDRVAARALVKSGEAPRDTTVDLVEHAAWTGLCTVILNLDETLTKQ